MVFMNVQTYYSGREREKQVETKEKVLIYYAVNILYVAITTSFMLCTIMIIMNSLFVSFNTTRYIAKLVKESALLYCRNHVWSIKQKWYIKDC